MSRQLCTWQPLDHMLDTMLWAVPMISVDISVSKGCILIEINIIYSQMFSFFRASSWPNRHPSESLCAKRLVEVPALINLLIHIPGIHECAPLLPLHVSERAPGHWELEAQSLLLWEQGSPTPTQPSTPWTTLTNMRSLRSAPVGRMLRRTYATLGEF